MPLSYDQVKAARDKALILFRVWGVSGVGITKTDEGKLAVKVNLYRQPAAGDYSKEIDGVPVIIDIVGPVKAGHVQ
jgi:hypothetical protein